MRIVLIAWHGRGTALRPAGTQRIAHIVNCRVFLNNSACQGVAIGCEAAADLDAHESYVNAVAAFSRQEYSVAARHISSWLSRFSNADANKGPYRDFLALEAIAKVTSLAQDGRLSGNVLSIFDRQLEEANPSAPIWVIAESLSVLRTLTLSPNPSEVQTDRINDELRAISEGWRLMARGVRLDVRPIRKRELPLPAFLDVFAPTSETGDSADRASHPAHGLQGLGWYGPERRTRAPARKSRSWPG